MRLGLGMPILQQVPGRAGPWEGGLGPAELVRLAQAADRLGFAWVTCSDHIAVPRSRAAGMGATWYEPVATLSFLAAHTSRVALLSHVLVLPYRHPLLVAKSFATLDRLSGGRVIVGVGSGHLQAEFRSLGLNFEGRGRQSDEALEALSLALAEECSSFAGDFFSWRDMVIAPRPIQQPRPSIWVGGNGAAAVRRALRLADGWIPWQVELAEFRQRVAWLRRHLAPNVAEFAMVAPASFGAAETVEDFAHRAEAWIEAGATAFHLGIESRSLEHHLERMAEIARLTDFAPRAG